MSSEETKPLGQVNYEAFERVRLGNSMPGATSVEWKWVGFGPTTAWAAAAIAVADVATAPLHQQIAELTEQVERLKSSAGGLLQTVKCSFCAGPIHIDGTCLICGEVY